ncbi:hypothetical protein AVEN_15418-1 [Araneus ventricosus]|uniref:Uncharacterized protein n=1 Tax=Araneus ventricosus TaxID=182803 RepID=A0A4Y2CRU3_ARAVE|nr:hypothetical protein AVEN_15418-1 [Araneus ventricosus]
MMGNLVPVSLFFPAYCGHGSLEVTSQLRGRKVPCSKPDSTEDLPCMCVRQIMRREPNDPRWCGAEVWRGAPGLVSSSSSDRWSKLRGPSQNSSRVASKRDVNIIKPNFLYIACLLE